MGELTAEEIVRILELETLAGEGGMFRNTLNDGQSTAIYFLIERDQPTMLHRLPGPEMFHFYAGAPARMLLLSSGGGFESPVLGTDLAAGQRPQLLVENGRWQSAETLGDWSLLGTTMAPGYHQEDFELGSREDLLRGWPYAADEIERHTSA